MKKLIVFLISLFVVPVVVSQEFKPAEAIIDCTETESDMKCGSLEEFVVEDLNKDGLLDVIAREQLSNGVSKILVFYQKAEAASCYSPGNDTFTKLLIHSDNADGNQNFVDSSGSNHPIATHGTDVHHEVNEKKFGKSSIQFDGIDDYLSIPDHEDWNFGAGDFTIDFWINAPLTSDGWIVGQWSGNPNSDNAFALRLTPGYFTFYYTENGTNYSAKNLTHYIPANIWHHVAFIRSGSSLKLYINGGFTTSTDIGTGVTIYDSQKPLTIGKTADDADFEGYLDEFRISKTVRWASNFTSPAFPYCNNK